MATSPDSETRVPGLTERERELKAAVIAADHAQAERAVTDYVEELQRHWESLSETDRADSKVPKRSQELLAWAREMALIQRNLAADQHAALQKARRYHGATCRSGLQVEG